MITKITVSELAIGMYIQKFPGSWVDQPFFKSSLKLESIKQIEKIKAKGITEVYIDTEKGDPVSKKADSTKPQITTNTPPASLSTNTKPVTLTKKINREAAIEKAKLVCDQAKDCVKDMFDEVRMGNAVNLSAINPVVTNIVSSVEQHHDALLTIARLKNSSDYTYMHSVAVCGLMVALSKKMNLNTKQTEQAGLAGLLHDIGKVAMEDEILNKPGKLTDEEYITIKSHTTEGYKILSKTKMEKAVLDVVLHHHEKVDGSGYPDQLTGNDISVLSRMGAICDVYDAVTSNRPYSSGWDPALALKRMSSWEGHFDRQIFSKFVQCLGIYPTGSLVKMSSGHLAVIIEQNSNDLMKPAIKMFYSTKSKQMCPIKIIDLAKDKNELKIESIEKPESWNIKVADDFCF